MNIHSQNIFKALIVLTLSVFIASGCAATEESVTRLKSLEQAFNDAITVTLTDTSAFTHMVDSVIDTTTDPANPTGTIIITGLTNACTTPPCAAAGNNLGTLTIIEDGAVFTIQDGDFFADIPDLKNAQNKNVTNANALTITNLADDSTIPIDIIIEYSSVAVADIIAAVNDISNLIVPKFFTSSSGIQTLNVALSADTSTILLSGINFIDGSGIFIKNPQSLPDGYAVTTSDGALYSFADPDGAAIDDYPTTALAEGVLSLAERDTDDAVVNGNEINFAVTLQLNAIPTLEAKYVTFSPDLAEVIIDHENKKIIITKLTNACSLPPCIAAEDNAISTLTITAEHDVFAFVGNAARTNIAIPDQDGATNTPDVPLASVTFQRIGDRAYFTYEVIAQYSSMAVAELISNAGGIENMLAPTDVIVDFSTVGQDAVASWNNDVLTITNIPNFPGTVETGTVTPASSLLPTGYYVSPSVFTNPAGKAAIQLDFPTAISIAEGDAAIEPPVTDNNQAFYDLRIYMKKTPDVALTASDLDFSITNTLNAIQDIATSDILVIYEPPSVIITAAADIHNLNEVDFGVSGEMFTLELIDTSSTFSIDTANLITTFSEPAGTETVTLDLGTFNAVEDIKLTSYDFSLVLVTTYNLMLDTEVIADMETSASAPYVIAACTNPATAIFTIDADGNTNDQHDIVLTPTNYYYDTAAAANNTNAIILTTDTGSVLNFTGAIGVQECDSFAGGDGSAATPWQINNDMRLNLLSRRVNDDFITSTHNDYYNRYYTLTADINMDIIEAPWAENSSHPNANTHGFVPIGKTTEATSDDFSDQTNYFSGQLDCETNATRYVISNLYISNTNETATETYSGFFMGLFGVLTTGAVLTNCTLDNANITGYQFTSGMAGYARIESSDTSITISSNTITNSRIVAHHRFAGGIVGYAYGKGNNAMLAFTSNIITDNSITASNSYVGGVAGAILATNGASNNISSNLVTDNNSIATAYRAGGIIGHISSADTASNILILNTVTNNSFTVTGDVGGIVGYIYNVNGGSSILSSNAVTDNSFTATTYSAGGIVGIVYSVIRDTYDYDNSVVISNNTVTGGSITAASSAGGIAGSVSNNGSRATNTFVSNTVTGSSITSSTSNAGGIAGKVVANTNSSNRFASNTMTGGSITAASNAGGAIGYSSNADGGNTTILAAFVTTTINTSSGGGGLVGYANQGDIVNSVFIGSLTADSGAVGGILGTAVNSPSISNVYTAAIITGTPDSSYGLAPTSEITVVNSYYDNTLNTGAADSALGTRAQSSDNLQLPTGISGIYANWDAAIWDFGTDTQYPILKNLPFSASQQCTAANAVLTSVTLDCSVAASDTSAD